jgi:DNA-binding NarL/FixJ family response regulator
MKPCVLLADDHMLVLDGLSKLLENDFELAGTANNGMDLLAKAEALKPDVILVDISMPGLNGLDAARGITEKSPASKLIFVTMHSNEAYVREAFRVGASGYVLKSSAASELAHAVNTVMNGGTYIASAIRHRVQPSDQEESKVLTPRQREVLRLIASGSTAKEISTSLKISVRTAEFHKVTIMQKLGIRTTAQLTRFAMENGLG